jgi:hypothetical protein
MVEIHKPPNIKVLGEIWVGVFEDEDGKNAEDWARRSKEVNQSWRLLSLAAVRDRMDRGEAAKIGGMDRRTLRATGFTVSTPLGRMGSSTTGRMVRRKRRRAMMTFTALVVAAILVVSILYAMFSRTRWAAWGSPPPHSIFDAAVLRNRNSGVTAIGIRAQPDSKSPDGVVFFIRAGEIRRSAGSTGRPSRGKPSPCRPVAGEPRPQHD